MKRPAFLLALLVWPAALFGIALGPVDVTGYGFAEYRSAYYSRGNIVNNGPVLPLFAQLVGSTERFGYLGGNVFTMNALTSGCQSGNRRNAFNEIDPKVYYGYAYDFGNGWALDNTISYQFVWLSGYPDLPNRHEWHVGQRLKNPYVTPYYLWRHAFEGAKWNLWQVGLTRAFPLGHGFELRPKFWCDFGDKNLFRVQYGQECTDGLMALNGELRLEWWFMTNLGMQFAVHQFDVVSSSGRDALNSNHRIQATTDLTIFTVGLAARF